MSRAGASGQIWSMRQARLAAGVSEAQARAVVRSGVLGDVSAGFAFADVVALRVAVLVSSTVFPGETRPANTSREVLPRQLAAVEVARQVAEEGHEAAVLLVYPGRASLAATAAELAGQVLASSEVYLSLPVGAWVAQLRASESVEEGAA